MGQGFLCERERARVFAPEVLDDLVKRVGLLYHLFQVLEQRRDLLLSLLDLSRDSAVAHPFEGLQVINPVDHLQDDAPDPKREVRYGKEPLEERELQPVPGEFSEECSHLRGDRDVLAEQEDDLGDLDPEHLLQFLQFRVGILVYVVEDERDQKG